MNNAEQFLADLETKAKAATTGPWHIVETDDDMFMNTVYVSTTPETDNNPEKVIAITLRQSPLIASIADEKWDENAVFIAAGNPAAVLRLVGMVRWLATAAANNGWHGVRVSPEQMREAAHRAVEEEACPKN